MDGAESDGMLGELGMLIDESFSFFKVEAAASGEGANAAERTSSAAPAVSVRALHILKAFLHVL